MEAASHALRLEGYPEVKPPPPQPGQPPTLSAAGWVPPPGWEGLQVCVLCVRVCMCVCLSVCLCVTISDPR
jgi:hypothetical protein